MTKALLSAFVVVVTGLALTNPRQHSINLFSHEFLPDGLLYVGVGVALWTVVGVITDTFLRTSVTPIGRVFIGNLFAGASLFAFVVWVIWAFYRVTWVLHEDKAIIVFFIVVLITSVWVRRWMFAALGLSFNRPRLAAVAPMLLPGSLLLAGIVYVFLLGSAWRN